MSQNIRIKQKNFYEFVVPFYIGENIDQLL